MRGKNQYRYVVRFWFFSGTVFWRNEKNSHIVAETERGFFFFFSKWYHPFKKIKQGRCACKTKQNITKGSIQARGVGLHIVQLPSAG